MSTQITGNIHNIIDHKNGVTHPLAWKWTEEEAHNFAKNQLGLKSGEYTLAGKEPVNESQYWPD